MTYINQPTVTLDAHGELPLLTRREQVVDLMAEMDNTQEMLAFWGVLGLACARRCATIWSAAFPHDNGMLVLAAACVDSRLAGEIPPLTETMLWTARNHIDETASGDPATFPALYAGCAAWAVARDMVAGGLCSVDVATEESMESEEWDPAYYASLALAGGATWGGSVDKAARREFWTWYVETALPEALATIDTRRTRTK